MSRPLWLKAVHKVERAIGEPVESAVHSDTYFDAVAELMRLRRKAIGAVEGVSRRCLHLLNLPAAPTCGACASSSSRMERRMDELHDEPRVERRQGGAG